MEAVDAAFFGFRSLPGRFAGAHVPLGCYGVTLYDAGVFDALTAAFESS